MDVADLLAGRRGDLLVVVEGASPWPSIVSAIMTQGLLWQKMLRVLLVPGRVGGDLAELDVIGGEGGLEQHDAVLGGEPLLEWPASSAAWPASRLRSDSPTADAGHDAEALRLDEDLRPPRSLACRPCCRKSRTRAGTTRRPSRARGRGGHLLRVGPVGRPPRRRGRRWSARYASRRDAHEHAGDEDRLGRAARLVAGGLERLAGRLGEAVEVQAVVPVGAADERQAVRADPVERVVEGALAGARRAVASLGSLSKGTCSSRIAKSPVSLM